MMAKNIFSSENILCALFTFLLFLLTTLHKEIFLFSFIHELIVQHPASMAKWGETYKKILKSD